MQTHFDVVVHGHKGLFMLQECKRILNKQVAGEGLWDADLAKAQDRQKGEVVEVREAGDEPDDVSDAASGSCETSDSEHGDADMLVRRRQVLP